MASSYVNNLRLNEMATGDASGTWGTITNTNLELIGEALGFGTRAIANASTDNITIADGASDSDRAMYLKLTGGGQACTVTLLPNTVSKLWFMENGTNSALTFTQGSGANVIIPAGDTMLIASDGGGSDAIVYDVFASLSVVDLKVQNDLTVNDDILLNSDSSAIKFGAGADATLTHTNDVGLTLNGTNKLMFNDASQFIQGSSATVLSIGATNEIDLTATAIDVNGTMDVSGAFTNGSTIVSTGVVTANAGVVVDEMTLDGDTLTATDTFTIDAVEDITLDAASTLVRIKHNGTQRFIFNTDATPEIDALGGDFTLHANTSDADIIFKGNDGGAAINALTLDMSNAGAASFSGNIFVPDNKVVSLGAGGDIALSSNGTNGTIAAPNGDLTLDVAGDLIIDVDGQEVFLKDAGTHFGGFKNVSSDFVIKSVVSDKDMIFQGTDGGSGITALTLDMSAGGNALFNNTVAVADGDASAPGFRFKDDLNNGMFRAGTDIIGLSTDGTERLRIDSGGVFLIGTTSGFSSCKIGVVFDGTNLNGIVLKTTRTVQTGSNYLVCVNSSGAVTGSIQQTGTTTVAFNTSSDYRLKENVVTDWDATTRLKQLKPSRFNFIADGTDRVVDGFLAHEVSSIVPEAICGEKDAVDADGNAVMQGIDQSKLVPLLVKTIQELEARITTLENA